MGGVVVYLLTDVLICLENSFGMLLDLNMAAAFVSFKVQFSSFNSVQDKPLNIKETNNVRDWK